jgi:hypothetical protein
MYAGVPMLVPIWVSVAPPESVRAALETVLFGDEDAAHPTAAQLAFERVGVAERSLELLADVEGQITAGRRVRTDR